MTITQIIVDYPALKVDLRNAIDADDTIPNIQAIVDDIIALQADILSNYSSTSMAVILALTTEEFVDYMMNITRIKHHDHDLYEILQHGFNRTETQIQSGAAYEARKESFRSMIMNTLATDEHDDLIKTYLNQN
ncbi:MAG: hypothetical protein ABWZ79_05940 [Pedobacter agri]